MFANLQQSSGMFIRFKSGKTNPPRSMIHPMKGLPSFRWPRSICRWVVVLLVTLAPATTALAQRTTDEAEIVDARLEGYEGSVQLPEASSGMTWVLFIILGIVIAAGLFKDAKRTHLD